MTDATLGTFFDDVITACTKAKAALGTVPVPSSPQTDRLPRPKPDLPKLGPAGFTFTDPTFGSKMVRITDEKTGGGSTSWRTSSGSDRIWNADGSLFFLENSGGGNLIFKFNPLTLQATPWKVCSVIGPLWDQNKPTVLYGRDPGERPMVTALDVSTDARWPAADVPALVPGITGRGRTYLRGISQAGSALAFICGGTGQDSDDTAIYIAAGAKPKILNTKTTAGLGFFAHASALDASGRYVILGATAGDIAAGKAPNYVWDTTFDTYAPITAFPGGHGTLGYGVSINASNDADSQEYRWRDLVSPNTTRLVITDLPKPSQSYASSHLSWNHVKPGNEEPFVVGNFRFGPGYAVTAKNPWREWDDEIISVSVDGKNVRRHCHHRSDVRPDNLPPDDTHVAYWATPRPRTSADGKWCLFTTNWERMLGADPLGAGDLSAFRQDVILVSLA